MTHRIEITIIGTAPDDELARARTLAGDAVRTAIEGLTLALEDLGFKHKVTVQTVRTGNRGGKSGRPKGEQPKLVEPAAAE